MTTDHKALDEKATEAFKAWAWPEWEAKKGECADGGKVGSLAWALRGWKAALAHAAILQAATRDAPSALTGEADKLADGLESSAKFYAEVAAEMNPETYEPDDPVDIQAGLENQAVTQAAAAKMIRALLAASAPSADAVDAKEAQEMLHGLDGSQYGLQFGDGSIRKGRSLRPNEMAIIRKGLKLLAASAPKGDGND